MYITSTLEVKHTAYSKHFDSHCSKEAATVISSQAELTEIIGHTHPIRIDDWSY